MERYKDYRKALADGYYIAMPELNQSQYHFINKANTREADLQLDPVSRRPFSTAELRWRNTSWRAQCIQPARTQPKLS
jgi:hypothetical protein